MGGRAVTARERAARPRRARQPAPPIADTPASDAGRAATAGNARRGIGGASPEYVINVWVSDQLRPKHARTGPSLWQVLEAGRGPVPRAEPRPDPEPEAEP
jgi:hypothetical protein